MGAKKEPEQMEFDFDGADLGLREPIQLALPFEERQPKPQSQRKEYRGPTMKLGDCPTIREQLLKASQGLKGTK